MAQDKTENAGGPARSGDENGFLFGQFLVSTPAIIGGPFEHSVVFVSAHDKSGALGMIINKEVKNVDSRDMLETMKIKLPRNFKGMPIYLGGPVDTGRGFVLHSSEYALDNTIKYPSGVSVTSERKVLQDYVDGIGPKKLILALGYAGWAKGQLENELVESAWVNVPADYDLVFNPNNDGKWQKAGAMNGIDVSKIVPTIGLA